MSFAPYNSPSHEKFVELKLLKVRDVIKMEQLKLAYNFHIDNLPEDLSHLFVLSSDMNRSNIKLNRDRDHFLYLSKTRTSTYGLSSVKYHYAKIWNETFKHGIEISSNPKKVVPFKKIKNIHHFKRILKKHFLHTYSLL